MQLAAAHLGGCGGGGSAGGAMNFVIDVKVASAGPGKITILLQRLSLAFVMCVTGAWALELVSPAMLSSTGVPAWSRLHAFAAQHSCGDEGSGDEVPLCDNPAQDVQDCVRCPAQAEGGYSRCCVIAAGRQLCAEFMFLLFFHGSGSSRPLHPYLCNTQWPSQRSCRLRTRPPLHALCQTCQRLCIHSSRTW